MKNWLENKILSNSESPPQFDTTTLSALMMAMLGLPTLQRLWEDLTRLPDQKYDDGADGDADDDADDDFDDDGDGNVA